MAAQQNSVASILKQPYAIALIIIAIAIGIIWISQKPELAASGTASTAANSNATQTANSVQAASNKGSGTMPLKPQAPGGDTPQIVAKMNQQRKSGSVSAPGLDRLVKGLEEKVAADPGNIDNRLLLAQTYNELGMQDKALTEMRALKKQNPDHGRVNLILGSMLSRSSDPEKVKESLPLLDKASGDKTIQQYLVELYKGEALIRMQDHEGALKHWKKALENMPPTDNRRAKLERRIAELSAKEGKAADNSNSKTSS
jgi:tetratricopeptide (TPR) repeat protein